MFVKVLLGMALVGLLFLGAKQVVEYVRKKLDERKSK